MNGIESRKEPCPFARECLMRETSKKAITFQAAEETCHLRLDVLRQTEDTSSLREHHGAVPTRPSVDITEEVVMDRTVVRRAEPSGGKRLSRPLQSARRLERPELDGVANTKTISKDVGPWITVRIREGAVQIDQFFLPKIRAISDRL